MFSQRGLFVALTSAARRGTLCSFFPLGDQLLFRFCFIALVRGCQLDVGKRQRSAEEHQCGAIWSWQQLPAFPDDSSQLFLCSAYCRMPSQRLGILILSSACSVELLSGPQAEWGAAGTGGTGTACGAQPPRVSPEAGTQGSEVCFHRSCMQPAWLRGSE